MEWLIFSLVATLGATVVLALVYAFLYFHERKLALGLWTLAWICCSFRYLVELGWFDRRAGDLFILCIQEFSLLMGLLLLWGCYAWQQKRLPVVWWIVATACGIWAILGVAADWSQRLISLPIFLFVGISFVMTGVSFWQRKDLGQVGRRVLAVAFLLWAFHKFDYPFFRTTDTAQSWGYFLSLAFSLVVAVGLLAVYLDRERRLLDTRSHMQGLLDSTQESLILIDREGRVLACNETIARRLGTSADELLNRNLYQVLPEPTASVQRNKIESVFLTGHAIEFEDERDGRLYWNYMSPVLNPDGTIRAVALFAEDITRRRHAEVERHRLFTYSMDLLCTGGFDGYLRELNPAWTRTLGWSETELKSRPWLDFVHPDDQTACAEVDKRLAAGQTVTDFENRFQCKDGSWRWLSWNTIPLVDQGQVFAVARDITERKQADAKLRENEEKFSKMFRLNPEAMSITRLSDGCYLEVNDAFIRLSGYSRQEVIGRTSTEIGIWVDPRDRIQMIEALREHGKLHQFQTRFYRKDRSIVTALFSAVPIEMRGEQYLLGIVMDISEQLQLRAERDRLFNYSIDPMCVAGFDGYFKQLNPAWSRALGWSAEELMARPWLEFVHPDDRRVTEQAGKDLTEGKSVNAFENRYRCKDGSWRWLSWNSFPLPRENLIFAAVRDVTDQKKAEQALREGQAALDGIYRAAPTGIGMVSNRVFVQINDRICEMTGYSREELIGQSSRMLYPTQQDYDFVGSEKYDQIRRLGWGAVETRWRRKDGTILDILLSSAPLNVHNLAEGVVFTAMDITERKKAETALKESEERYRITALMTGQLIYDYDCEKGRIQWCGSIPSITGYTTEEFQSVDVHAWAERIHPLDRDRILQALNAAMTSGQIFLTEYRFRRKDGSYVWVEDSGSFIPNPEGKPRRMLGAMKNISERKTAEEAVRESQRRLVTLMSNLPGIAYRCLNNRDWTMEFISDGCMDLTGYPASDLVNNARLSYNDIVVPEDRDMVWDTVQKALAENRAYQITYRIRAADGAVKWVWEQGRGVYDESGNLEALEGFVSDMTARILAEKQREDLLKTLQVKTEELESIIYVSSHDLRSPLVNIQGFSGELEESCRQVQKILAGNTVAESAEQRLTELLSQDIPAALEYITTSVSKLDALQKGLLKICRIGRESLDIRKVAMNDLIDGVLKSIHFQTTQCGATITVESLSDCLADAGQLTQVFINLIDNAIKYRSPDRPPVIRIYGRVEDKRSVYSVADNGIGIAPEHQKKVFEMFHQLDPANGPRGEGLGLTIVKRILGRMDGQIRLESAPGVGSVFSVILPKA